MKSIKIATAAFVVTVVLVASFAFTRKPVHMVFYNYTPSSGQKVVDPADDNAIIASELNSTSNWTSVLSVGTHSSGAPRLLAIEFDADQQSESTAIGVIKSYYDNHQSSGNAALPDDQQSTSGVEVFRF